MPHVLHIYNPFFFVRKIFPVTKCWGGNIHRDAWGFLGQLGFSSLNLELALWQDRFFAENMNLQDRPPGSSQKSDYNYPILSGLMGFTGGQISLLNRGPRVTLWCGWGHLGNPGCLGYPWEDSMLTYMKTHKSQPNVGKYTTYMDGMGSGYFHDAVNTALYIHTYICRIYTFTCE